MAARRLPAPAAARASCGRGVFGSRLALRLVLLFALVAVLPGALVYAVSVQFLGKRIESWFDVRVDRALEGGLNLGRSALDYAAARRPPHKAGAMALDARRCRAAVRRRRCACRVRRAGRRRRGGAASPRRAAVLAVAGSGPRRRRRRSRRRRRRCAGRACSRCRRRSSRAPEGALLLRVVVPVNVDDRLRAARGCCRCVEPVPREPRAGRREGAGGLARLPGDLAARGGR
ncbi:MAG: hypothetical protein MZW92_69145 [Comamonadaceae bacterium]|nr:hypothetical protein [Comamonadaceae bacterium]